MNWGKITPAILSLLIFLLAQAIVPIIAFGIGILVSPDFGKVMHAFLNDEISNLPFNKLMPATAFAFTIMAPNIIAILVCHFFLHNIRPIKVSDITGIRWKPGLLAIAGGMLATTCMSFITEDIAMPDSMMEMALTVSKNAWGVLALCIVGPITEELLFREAIEGEMLRRETAPWLAICISALAFSTVHLNLAQGLYALPIGIIFGIIRYKTGNIILPTLIHILNNSIATAQLYMLERERSDIPATEISGGNTETYIAILLSGALSILLMTLFWKSTTTKQE